MDVCYGEAIPTFMLKMVNFVGRLSGESLSRLLVCRVTLLSLNRGVKREYRTSEGRTFLLTGIVSRIRHISSSSSVLQYHCR